MTTGEEIFWKNARSALRDTGMSHLDPAHGAAVDAVRWCCVVRGRPTHHRQAFLERESLALLAYLEKLATSADATGWRSLEERIRHHAEVLHESDVQRRASRPWLAAIWHALPELAGIGQMILDGRKAPVTVADFEVVPETSQARAESAGDSDSGDDKGSGGKAGSAGTTARPRPSPLLSFPVVAIVLTDTERKALDLDDDVASENPKVATAPEGPDGTNVQGGPKGPDIGGKK